MKSAAFFFLVEGGKDGGRLSMDVLVVAFRWLRGGFFGGEEFHWPGMDFFSLIDLLFFLFS